VSAVAETTTAGLAEQARQARAGEASAVELVTTALERARAAQQTLNAFRIIRDEEALADAEAIRRLREAGAIVIGKTHAPEVGQWHFTETPLHGVTRNPWNTDHTPGGSSGGAAAAVAAGVVPAAIGSDGAGSIRIPAAWTGLVGLKPQRGRVSTWPDAEAFNGLSCYGPLARSAGDAALLLDAVCGNVPADLHKPRPPSEPFAAAAAREPARLRIALSFATPFGVPNKVDPEHRAAIEAFATRLGELGHDVFPADPDYGMVGPAIVPRGMGRGRRMARRPRRGPWGPGATHPGPRSPRQNPARSTASPLAHGRARAAPPDRPHIRALRRRPHPDHGEAASAHRRPRGPWLLGDKHDGKRHLSFRLRLERCRLARDQRSRRPHRRGPADRRPAPGAGRRRGNPALPGGLGRACRSRRLGTLFAAGVRSVPGRAISKRRSPKWEQR
jgi:hypothetical protein